MRKTTSGFTIIELVVTIVVIGILATIGTISLNVVQAKTRDSQRASQIDIIADALESYYLKNGEYPSCGTMVKTNLTEITSSLTSLDTSALKAPKDNTDNSISGCAALSAGSADDKFAYVCSADNACEQYTLQYKSEVTGAIVSKNSRYGDHETNVAIETPPAQNPETDPFFGWPIAPASQPTIEVTFNMAPTPKIAFIKITSNTDCIQPPGGDYYYQAITEYTTDLIATNNTSWEHLDTSEWTKVEPTNENSRSYALPRIDLGKTYRFTVNARCKYNAEEGNVLAGISKIIKVAVQELQPKTTYPPTDTIFYKLVDNTTQIFAWNQNGTCWNTADWHSDLGGGYYGTLDYVGNYAYYGTCQ